MHSSEIAGQSVYTFKWDIAARSTDITMQNTDIVAQNSDIGRQRPI